MDVRFTARGWPVDDPYTRLDALAAELGIAVEAEEWGGTCPVQGLGTVVAPTLDREANWYFRARGWQWSFAVSYDDPIDDDASVFVLYGEADGDPADIYRAGYMSDEEAVRHMREALVRLLAGERGVVDERRTHRRATT